VWLRNKSGKYTLYTKRGSELTPDQKSKLFEYGIELVYVSISQKGHYDRYIEHNLAQILEDDTLALEVRGRVFYEHSADTLKSFFEKKIPLDKGVATSVAKLVKASIKMLSDPNSLRAVGRLMSHDYQTFSHSLQVYLYAMSLFKHRKESLSVSEEDLIQMGIGAMLHDIGKVKVPKGIITKPAKLDPQEWEIMKKHSIFGLGIARQLSLSVLSLESVILHHEKFNGKGYPNCLEGEEIPLFVRCVSIADVYDAITAERPYAPAQDPRTALEIMTSGMKDSFDPSLLADFIRVLGGAGLAKVRGL
jgi:putative nucleotidyltransferase with HDIG domain